MERRPRDQQTVGIDETSKGPTGMDTFLQDIRFTCRQWRRAPGFAALAILTIALGAGGTSTMISVSDSVLLRSQPGVREPEGLVEIRTADRAGRGGRPMSFATFEILRNSNIGLAELAGGDYSEVSVTAEGWGIPKLEPCVMASENLFSVLGTRPALGRFFSTGDEDAAEMGPVVVLSHRLWVQEFSEDPSVLGATISLNRQPFTVIGVAEKGFHGHLPLFDFGLFVPISSMESLTGRPTSVANVLTVGRLSPGSSQTRVRSATDALANEFRAIHPTEWASRRFLVEPHSRSFQEFRGPITLFLGFLLALSICVLFIACANLAGVLLSRALERAHEMAVRQALGAGRKRLLVQLLTEFLLLFLLGGLGGILLALVGTWTLGRIEMPIGVPLTGEYGPNLPVLALSMGLTLTAGVLFGVPPALRGMGTDVASVLKDLRGQAPRRQWLRRAFVVVQIAGAVVLLGGSGVLFRALQRAAAMDFGFEARGVHVATVNLGIQQYTEEEGRVFFTRLLAGAEELPGIESAALADFLFLVSPPERAATFTPQEGEGSVQAGLFGISPAFFRTLGVEVLEGRPFQPSDLRGGEPVAMVNERVAGILWPEESPVGKTLRSEGELLRVVGLVENGKYISVGEAPLAGIFRPQAQHYVPNTSLVLKLRAGAGRVEQDVQGLIQGLDPDIPLSVNVPYPSLLERHFLPRRMAAVFAGILGMMGLLLAALGVFGVLAALVSQKSSELALRVALGATPGAVRGPILRSGLALVIAGLILGIPMAVGLSSLIRIFLYGLDPSDPVTFGTVTLLFLLIGLFASYIPAVRATRADPARVLRQT